jgi:hypothetical protein
MSPRENIYSCRASSNATPMTVGHKYNCEKYPEMAGYSTTTILPSCISVVHSFNAYCIIK